MITALQAGGRDCLAWSPGQDPGLGNAGPFGLTVNGIPGASPVRMKYGALVGFVRGSIPAGFERGAAVGLETLRGLKVSRMAWVMIADTPGAEWIPFPGRRSFRDYAPSFQRKRSRIGTGKKSGQRLNPSGPRGIYDLQRITLRSAGDA